MAEVVIISGLVIWTVFVALQGYKVGFRHGLEEIYRQYEEKKDSV